MTTPPTSPAAATTPPAVAGVSAPGPGTNPRPARAANTTAAAEEYGTEIAALLAQIDDLRDQLNAVTAAHYHAERENSRTAVEYAIRYPDGNCVLIWDDRAEAQAELDRINEIGSRVTGRDKLAKLVHRHVTEWENT